MFAVDARECRATLFEIRCRLGQSESKTFRVQLRRLTESARPTRKLFSSVSFAAEKKEKARIVVAREVQNFQ